MGVQEKIMSISLLIVAAFANWRIAHLLSSPLESGPWGVLDKLRWKLGVRFDEYSIPYGTTVLSRGIICLWCSSVWVGVVEAILALASPTVALALFLPFALSGVAILLNHIIED